MKKPVTGKAVACGRHGNKVLEDMSQVIFVNEETVNLILKK
jgi:hypothetical protein